MKKTRDIIQAEALQALKANEYNGTCVINTGGGKGKVAIDAIKDGKFKSSLITSPRTNLQTMWKKELEKWNIHPNLSTEDAYNYHWHGFSYNRIYVSIINIQTCYKWTKETISKFDVVIADEIHTIVSPEYSKLIINARELNIPVIALTATPSLHDTFKEEFYKKYIPIIYEYHDSAKDGIINKRRYFIYQYELSDDYKVIVKTKSKEWIQGELSRYNYIESIFESSKLTIENFYFNEIKARVKTLNVDHFRPSYKRFFNKITSKDLDYFRKIYWNAMKRKKLPLDLYKYMRFVSKEDYAKFGMKAGYYSSIAPEAIKSYFFKYVWARDERKEFLWNLSSSADIAVKIKNKILDSQIANKVLLFSELTTQANKLSAYSVHSKQDEETNKQLIHHFDTGKIRELSSVNSLTLGLNLVGANWAILESYNSSATSIQQKLGRTDRLKADDVSNIVIIVPKSTQAEQWFNEFSKSLDLEDAVYINNINDLKI